jgi:hypothetical protein
LLALLHADPASAAPWCGTAGSDDRPPAVAGPQVRLVYVIPSDGADNSATVLPQMSADVDAIEAWWQAQDPTRTPRFDRAAFACGAQADVELLRMSQTAAQLSVTDTTFETVANAVTGLDGLGPHYKYLVYYDGALDTTKLCGQGGGFYDGPGVAIVFVGACAGEPSAAVAAHELLHAMGALPSPGPQHSCGAEDSAHACDSSQDIMWPFATLVPLTSLLLDVNRDDYYAHSGAWADLQDTRFLRRLDAQGSLALTLNGSGSVVSDIPGVSCTATCATQWDTGSGVTLTATPAGGQRFVRWGGSCAGSGPAPECKVSVAQATQITALFGPPTYALRVSVAGKGTVRSGSGRVSCPARCLAAVPSYAATSLVARPAQGWRFKSWSGTCRGTRPVCTLPMRKASTARATFARAKKAS